MVIISSQQAQSYSKSQEQKKKINKKSLAKVFYKNFSKFIEKHLQWSHLLSKLREAIVNRTWWTVAPETSRVKSLKRVYDYMGYIKIYKLKRNE